MRTAAALLRLPASHGTGVLALGQRPAARAGVDGDGAVPGPAPSRDEAPGAASPHRRGTGAALCVIANGTAGQGCGPEWAARLRELFRLNGLDADVKVLHRGADILAAAKDAVECGAAMVVAAGGDGTVSAVASRLAGSNATLGVLPMGTLNHFAKDLGIPLALEDAVATIAVGHVADVDVGEVNGRTFINNSSLGLYPDIVLDREHQRRRLGRGKWRALLAASLHAARRYPVLSFDIELDGRRITRRSAFAFIGNNPYTMEGFDIGERPRLDTGRLSLYVTQRTGRFGLFRLALRALLHRLRQARDFDMLTSRELVVATRHRQMRVATDGEVTLMMTPLHYRVRPAALRVIVPAPAPAPKDEP
jgi:diacylglycerol kinase family enzyme